MDAVSQEIENAHAIVTRSGRCDVNCPHCNAEIERGEDPDYSQYDCPECGGEVVIDNTNRSED